MTARSALRDIPLDKLVLSPTNVRKTPSSAAEDAELEASIRASGLKQNHVVHPMGDAKDVHAVVAGGRRLKALRKLAAEGALPAGFKVPCLVEEPEAALETSLIGTFQFVVRKDMHLRWPRAETPTHFITMGLHEDLNEATKLAVREMIDFLMSEKKLSRDDAYMLSSVAADLSITELVDGNKGVHMSIPKAIFIARTAK